MLLHPNNISWRYARNKQCKQPSRNNEREYLLHNERINTANVFKNLRRGIVCKRRLRLFANAVVARRNSRVL